MSSSPPPPPPPPPAADVDAADYETLNRRYTLAVNLECWELLAMHSIANNESIPRIRLRMMKAFVGLPVADESPHGNAGGSGTASPSASSRRRTPKDSTPRRLS